MASYSEVAKRWTLKVLGRTDAKLLKAERMYAEVPRDRFGTGTDDKSTVLYSYGRHFELARLVTPRGAHAFFLVNGDTYSVTTARHQSEVRSAISATEVPSVIIPHTSAARAGIVLDSLRLVSADAERNETYTHTLTLPDGMASAMLDEAQSKCRAAVSVLRDKLAESGTPYGYREGIAEGTARRTLEDGTKIHVTIYGAGYEYGTAGTGAWTIRAEDDWTPSWYRNSGGLKRVDGDKFTYDTYRHFLGASVFTAKIQETVETWTDDAARAEESGGALRTRHNGFRTLYCIASRIRERRAYFVSAFDDETARGRPLYFLAELPRDARPKTVAEALEALAPLEVREALAAGLDVKRQGDIFCVPYADIADTLPIPFKYAERMAAVTLDGTRSHVATELVTLEGLGTFARGTLTHSGAEHKRVALGKTWHKMYRNTVPLTHGADTPRAWTIAGRVD